MSNFQVKMNQLVSKVVNDESFKKELVKNPNEVFKKEGIDTGGRNVHVVENTKSDFYLVVPKKSLPKEFKLDKLPKNPNLNQISAWIITQVQAGSIYKDKLMKDANAVLKEFGVNIPSKMHVRLKLNTDKDMYIALPRQVSENDELNDLELQAVSGGKGNSSSAQTQQQASTTRQTSINSGNRTMTNSNYESGDVIDSGNTLTSNTYNIGMIDF